MVPGIVLGVAIYVFLVEAEIATEWRLLGSLGGLAAGHVLIVIPWVVRLVTASLVGMDRSVEEAAMSLGADRFTTFRRVTLPSILPGVVAAALFGFVTSFGNLEVSLFLCGPRPNDAADCDPPVSRVEDRSDDRGRVRAADPADRGGDAGDGPLREDRAGGLMARLEITNLVRRYGDLKAVDDVSLSVADGEFLVLLGPSGCGKTTTLRMVAGFVEPTAGTIRLGDRDITHLPALEAQCRPRFPELTRSSPASHRQPERRLRSGDAEEAGG